MATQDIVKDAKNTAETYVNRGVNYATKQEKLKKEEAELEELMKAQYGSGDEETEELEPAVE